MAAAFTLDDFRLQMHQLREKGAIPSGTLPNPDDGPSLESIERVIDAMTDEERNDPAVIDEVGR